MARQSSSAQQLDAALGGAGIQGALQKGDGMHCPSPLFRVFPSPHRRRSPGRLEPKRRARSRLRFRRVLTIRFLSLCACRNDFGHIADHLTRLEVYRERTPIGG